MASKPTMTAEQKHLHLLAAQVSALTRIAIALETIVQAQAPAPNFIKPLSEYPDFDWERIGAIVKARDQHGATLIEWGGFPWTRRSPANKFDAAIWFSRPNGKDAEGNVKYIRLITFKKPGEAEPIPDKIAAKVEAHALDSPAESPKAPTPAQAEPSKPAAAAEAGHKGNGKRSFWPALIVKDILLANLAENAHNAVAMLNKSQVITPASDAETVLLWARAYRVARDEGQEPDDAAAVADRQIQALRVEP